MHFWTKIGGNDALSLPNLTEVTLWPPFIVGGLLFAGLSGRSGAALGAYETGRGLY